MSGKCPFSFLSRRSFIKSAGSGVGLLAASTGLGALTSKLAEAASSPESSSTAHPSHSSAHSSTHAHHSVPFWGKHQAGIVTPQQAHTYFASFDLVAKDRSEIIQLMKDWTEAAAKMSEGKTIELRKKAAGYSDAYSKDSGRDAARGDSTDVYQNTSDSGEAIGLAPGRLTLTFGFGPGLFLTQDGKDRYGLARHKPEALAELPRFHGDELIAEKTGGDLSVQACSDDPQVAFHAVRQLARMAVGVAQIRWAQSGFLSGGDGEETPRNLMGLKDGTQQPKESDYDKFVWIGEEGPAWLRGGSFMVARRIRIALEHWDGTEVDFQEQVFGRRKDNGAPLGLEHEKQALDLSAVDKDGNFLIPENSHIRLASHFTNDGAQILRRGYSYNDGVNFTAERWPPWRQGMEYDAGLFFVAYQTDPRTGFTKIFKNLAKLDALNQFVTHVGSAIFVCPPGAKKGEYVGRKLFEA